MELCDNNFRENKPLYSDDTIGKVYHARIESIKRIGVNNYNNHFVFKSKNITDDENKDTLDIYGSGTLLIKYIGDNKFIDIYSGIIFYDDIDTIDTNDKLYIEYIKHPLVIKVEEASIDGKNRYLYITRNNQSTIANALGSIELTARDQLVNEEFSNSNWRNDEIENSTNKYKQKSLI